jgi:hypothetical protein
MKIFSFFFLLFSSTVCCYADDSYDANSGWLTIPVVSVGGNNGTFYSNVKVTVGTILAIDSARRPPAGYDTYDPSTNQLGIPVVTVNGTSYQNVFITVGSVISVGGVCATAASCGVILTSTGSSAASGLIVTPAPYSQLVAASYQPPSLTSVTDKGFTNRSRYLISDVSSGLTSANFLSIGVLNSSGYGATASSFISSANPTMQSYLGSLIHAVSELDGNFRFDSHLHPNQSIDYSSSSNNLFFVNNFGYTTLTNLGYLTFSYNASTNLIQAKNRYTYSLPSSTVQITTSRSYIGYTPTHKQDTIFAAANYYVSLNSGVYSLVPSSSAATKFYLYAPPIDFGIPNIFNPIPVSFTPASPTPVKYGLANPSAFETKTSTSSLYSQISSKYQPQVAIAGTDSGTKSAASAILSTIASTAIANNYALRYSTTIYSAFRDALLANTLVSDTVFDGTPGQNSVPFVYFTNEKDSSGVYHPFMIIFSYGSAPTPSGLKDINSPPGLATTTATSVRDQDVTRFSNLGYALSRIPMKDYGIVTDVSINIYTPSSLSSVNTASTTVVTPDVYNYTGTADLGVLVNGAAFYSTMAELIGLTPSPSSSSGSLSVNGCHVGQGGGGPHCHVDGYQSGSAAGHGAYSDNDYTYATHPPLIGFGNDGVALFGQYRTLDTKLLGYGTVDSFGGHDHDSIGYHYHAHVIPNYSVTSNNVTNTFDIPALMKGAFIGNINSVPFFNSSTGNAFRQNVFLGGAEN